MKQSYSELHKEMLQAQDELLDLLNIKDLTKEQAAPAIEKGYILIKTLADEMEEQFKSPEVRRNPPIKLGECAIVAAHINNLFQRLKAKFEIGDRGK